jgi:hypothetical protein
MYILVPLKAGMIQRVESLAHPGWCCPVAAFPAPKSKIKKNFSHDIKLLRDLPVSRNQPL